MAQEVQILVTAKTSDLNRLCKRIETLSEVTETEEYEETRAVPPGDILVTCGPTARKTDVEELLLGVEGVKIKMLT